MAEFSGIDQSEISRINRGQLMGASESKQMELVAKLGYDIKIVIGAAKKRAGKVALKFA